MAITNDFFNALNDLQAAMWSAGVAFNRSNPLPLDKWSVFQSMAEAIAYAETNAVAYPGQIIAVYDINRMVACVLTEIDGKLIPEAIGVIPKGDDITIEIVDGKIVLVGFEEAKNGAQLVKGADGKLSWVVPSTDTVDGLQTTVATLQQDIKDLKDTLNPVDEDGNPIEGGLVSDVENLEVVVDDIQQDIADIENKIGDPANSELNQEATGLYKELEDLADIVDTKANTSDVYTKEETEDAIASAVANADHLKRTIVYSVNDIIVDSDDALYYIYMVPTGLEEDDDKYDEYMVIEFINADGETVRKLERVGSWEIDLSQYAKAKDLQDLAKTVAENKEAAENAIQAVEDALADEIERAEVAEKANADAIDEINETKVNKADVYLKNEVYTKGETDQAIADKISEVNGGESAGEVLGQLNAYKKIVNMEVWGDEKGSGDENGNSRIDNLVAQVATIINTKPFIGSVDDDFQVIEGKLILKELPISKIDGLQDMSDNLIIVQKQVGSLEDILNGYVNEETQEQVPGLVAEVQAIKTDYLTLVDFNTAVGNLEALLATNTTVVDRLETIEEVLKWQEMSGV